MSKSDESANRPGAVNIFTGGVQVVGLGEALLDRTIQELVKGLYLFKPLWAGYGATTASGDPHDDAWCVDGAGTVVQLSLTYDPPLDPKDGWLIYAKVFSGLNPTTKEPYDASFVKGTTADGGKTWTWSKALTGATPNGYYHVRPYKVNGTTIIADTTVAFRAVKC